MSDEFWQESLSKKLSYPSSRVAVVGIGNALQGDDAAGSEVIHLLQEAQVGSEDVLLLNVGVAPENYTGLLCGFAPDIVLLIDGAQINLPVGSIGWVDLADVGGMSASTHTLPLDVFAHYLTTCVGCDVALIGIQIASTEFDSQPSPATRRAVEELASVLTKALERTGRT